MISNEFRGIGKVISKSIKIEKQKMKNEDVCFFDIMLNHNREENPTYIKCCLFGKRIEALKKYGKNNPFIILTGKIRATQKEYKEVKYTDWSITVNEFQLFQNLNYKDFNIEQEQDTFEKDFDNYNNLEKLMDKVLDV